MLVLSITLKQRRAIFIGIIIAVCLCAGVSIGAIIYLSNKSINADQQKLDALNKQYDPLISKLKEKRLAESKAKEAAEKAKAEAEAKSRQDSATTPQPASCEVTGPHSNPSAIDVVINKKRCFNPIDYIPGDLSSYQGYVVSAKILPDMTRMFADAASAGTPLSLTSAYRSYSNQVTTYNNWVRVNGSTAAADTVSARPGYSEHQTGLAFDLSAGSCSLECFRGTQQYIWMQTTAAQYGFIERYPQGLESVTGYSPEAWHWRYVGPSTALSMKAKGIKTLEQLWNLPGGDY